MGEPKKAPALKYKVVSYTDYLAAAREKYGQEGAWDNAIAMVYNENEVVAVLLKGGEQKFVCKI